MAENFRNQQAGHTESVPLSEERQWRAFRYVSGEMSAEEAARLEHDLSTDLSLCDAVVDATKLTLSLATAKAPAETRPHLLPWTKPVFAPRTSNASASSRLLVVGVAVCCCLSLMAPVTFWSLSPAPQASSEMVRNDTDDAVLVLNAWLDGGEMQSEAEYGTEETLSAEIDVPDWMFAGVVLSDLNDDDMSAPDEG